MLVTVIWCMPAHVCFVTVSSPLCRLRFHLAVPSRNSAVPVSTAWVANGPSHCFWWAWNPSSADDPRIDATSLNASPPTEHSPPYLLSCIPGGSQRQPASTCTFNEAQARCVAGVSSGPAFACLLRVYVARISSIVEAIRDGSATDRDTYLLSSSLGASHRLPSRRQNVLKRACSLASNV